MDELNRLQDKYSLINDKINGTIKDLESLTKQVDKLISKMDVFVGSLSGIQTIIDKWIGALRIISLLGLFIVSGLAWFIKREVDHNDEVNQAQSQTIQLINTKLVEMDAQINFLKDRK